MSRVQLSVRIPNFLYEKLNTYINNTGASKTDIVVGALAHYLDCIENLPINHRVSELEARVSTIEKNIRKD